jgi:hypothetical protein
MFLLSGSSKCGKLSGRTPTTGARATLIVCPLSVMSNWLVSTNKDKEGMGFVIKLSYNYKFVCVVISPLPV